MSGHVDARIRARVEDLLVSEPVHAAMLAENYDDPALLPALRAAFDRIDPHTADFAQAFAASRLAAAMARHGDASRRGKAEALQAHALDTLQQRIAGGDQTAMQEALRSLLGGG